MRPLVLCSLPFVLFVVACSAGDCAPGGVTPDAGGTDAAKTSVLGFTPSNVDVSTLDFSDVGDLVVSSDKTWETDLGGTLGSDNAGKYHYEEIAQSNGLKLGVFTVKSLTIQSGVTVGVAGADALVIVALDKLDIEGKLHGNSQFGPARLGPGAMEDGSKPDVVGLGPGGGGAGTGDSSGGGAGFCGTGGAGAALVGAPAAGGPSYGTAELSPLVAGFERWQRLRQQRPRRRRRPARRRALHHGGR